MTAAPEPRPVAPSAGTDILSREEERALASVRGIAAAARARGCESCLDEVAEGVARAGGSFMEGSGEEEARLFSMGGAVFSLRALPGAGALIEIRFIPSRQ